MAVSDELPITIASGEVEKLRFPDNVCIRMGLACVIRPKRVDVGDTGTRRQLMKEWAMNDDPKNQLDRDPQDNQFGRAAAEDQELVDELAEDGVSEDELPDAPAYTPRAGDKAPPADDNAS